MYSVRLSVAFLFFINLLGMPPRLALAQLTSRPSFQCGTKSLAPQARRALDAQATMALRLKQAAGPASQARLMSGSANTTITYVPIRPHISRKSDGTGGYSLASLNNALALTNKQYLQNGSGLQFYFAGTTPDYIDNDAYYDQYSLVNLNNYYVTNALNPFFLHNMGGAYAFYPENNVASTRSVFNDNNDDDDMGNRLMPHELGHTFNLLHTFDASNGYELVTRGAGANCATAGDLVCDTPADPYGRFSDATSSCITGCPPSYICAFRDDQNNVYAPSPTNIMSYYYPCTHTFTPGQVERMQAGLALRQSHTAYTLDAPETPMAAPSNVVASFVNGAILITWQDNSSNEMGYFIERSTSPNTGFTPIGGVAPNTMTFTDHEFAAHTPYYYRIKASNSTTGSISPTAMTAATDYCRPTFTYDGCSYGLVINSVTFNGTALSQNSGCSLASNSYYSSFTVVSATVTAGQSATFTVAKGAQSSLGIYIWIDLNNDKFFDIGERLFQQPQTTQTSTVTGSLTIPADTPAGAVTMRIITGLVMRGTTIDDPCGSGNYFYGETEDYRLVINSACTTMYSLKAGSWDDPTVWSCNRVPTSTDLVQLGHAVVVPDNFTAKASRIIYTPNAGLTFSPTAQLQLLSSP